MSTAEAIIERARAIRHDIHAHPELAYEETRTADIVRGELDRLGIPWRACAGTGTVADLAVDRSGPMIALRADMDALPMDELNDLPYKSTCAGKMHACGHDGHTASLLAAAQWLKAHEDQLPQPVRLLFQPAEEGKAGAKAMIVDGALDGVAKIYGYHNWPPLPVGQAACVDGPMMAANGYFTLTLTGAGGHASLPENCKDVVLVGAQIVTALNTIVSRQVRPHQACVLSVTCFHAGTASNIIPETATISGTVRAPTTALREEIAERMATVANGIAASFAVRCDVAWTPCYPATVNDADCAAAARRALVEDAGISEMVSDFMPVMGAEDFSFYQEQIPGAYALIGAGRPGEAIEVCHSPRFDYNDALLPVALRYFASLVGAPLP